MSEELVGALMPLNCSGSSDEEIGQLMSNLAFTPFVMQGETLVGTQMVSFTEGQFASVEALYIALKTLDSGLRSDLATKWGMEAKHIGKKLSRKGRGITCTAFAGVEFELGSAEHHAVIKHGIRCKLTQNPTLLRAFVETSPRAIIHETGWQESRFTKLPAVMFCRMLTELRAELAQ